MFTFLGVQCLEKFLSLNQFVFFFFFFGNSFDVYMLFCGAGDFQAF